MRHSCIPIAAWIAFFTAAPLLGQSEFAFFEAKIRPVLIQHCYECHSGDVAESGLRLDSRERLRVGGDRGSAIDLQAPEESLLLNAISHHDADLKMPPRVERLPDSVIADFRRWIQQGAVDPRETPQPDSPSQRELPWSFRKPTKQVVPSVDSDWCRSQIDAFVYQALQQQNLRPTEDASASTLLRRLHFDLIGLPPSPEQIRNFRIAVSRLGFDAAIASEADRLLASPAMGERWGRHWLDVARYAESSGKETNISFPYAWRYRDYVLDAANDDTPFDRFLTEQIAGDLLPAENAEARTRFLVATGFLAIGPKNLDASEQQFAADVVDEQIDAMSRVFMASSVACARCHDHKFDPFTMQDYYALAGIFASTKTFFGTAVSPSNRIGGDPLLLPRLASTAILHPSIKPSRVAKLKADKAAMQVELKEKQAAKTLTLRDVLRINWRTGGIDGQLEKVDGAGNALPLTMGVNEAETIADTPLLLRGEVNRPSDRVTRGLPSVVCDAPSIPSDQSGRLQLASWLTSHDHPLTSRVIVNRVWMRLFGNGLVTSVDDFGSTGELPSHPELLDHMATKFSQQGWSIKRLVRELVSSRVYRQASTFDSDSFESDPENRFLWRMPKKRVEAEAMRDAMLVVSGQLDRSRPAGSLVGRVIGDRPVSLVGLNKKLPRDLDGAVHRSVYLPVMRDRLPDVLEVFDFAEPSLVTGKRESTNVPTQALYLMNSPFVRERAAALASRLSRETTLSGFVQRAFLLCYGRQATDGERESIQRFLEVDFPDRRVDCCHALMSTAEFRVLD
ncbi:MAG: PSD1 and planctomycete cytochrome C domain-containing protein [Rubripirellula sp.]